MRKKIIFSVVFILSIAAISSFTKATDLYMPKNIQKAYDNKTRSMDGAPGSAYWQNRADYSINVSFDPATRIVKGSETITYFNNSPDDLNQLIIHLFPNLYKKGNSRDFDVEFADESDGVQIEKMTVNGENINTSPESKSIEYQHSNLKLRLPEPLLYEKKLKLKIDWNYVLNKGSHQRTGAVDSTSFFIAYFFPRIAVYDDIDGWNDFAYTGTAEFYNDFGDFIVSVTVPENYIVWATGTLTNPEKVLREKYLKRYREAFTSNNIIHIVDSTECYLQNISKENTWKFKAKNVTDFAFAISDHYLWDATSLIVDKKTNRRVFIDAAYHKHAEDFYHVAGIARQAVEFMSYRFPGLPFPFPKVTVFNGADGMEYPMMVNDIAKEDINEAIKLTAHEILHSYLPFYVGCNETKYAWMDEGFTSFGDYLIISNLFSVEDANFYFLDDYRGQAGDFLDTPLFTTSEWLKRPVYTYNSYPKPASFFIVLQDYFGEEKFKKIIHEFMNRWNGKHPTPYDFFFTLYNVSGENLNWLIKPWFYEFGYVDLAVKEVSQKNKNYKIIVEKKGNIPVPIELKIIFADESEKLIEETAGVWKDGKSLYPIEVQFLKKIKSIKLIDKSLIDADLSNNIF
ncbi:M1 family metallopeptidase [candidate division KSB1 bacterium]|nr:M1 family metallopeptidase [candidate division KSB1 bacterium]MBL7093304.1 M1 family metallopeptidase [candidate division KSB1 bacterium]